MTDQDVLLDLLDTFGAAIHGTLDGVTLDCLSWRPDAEANNIALTLWHISRALDLLKVRLLEGRPPEEELWHVNGWTVKTSYDPRGCGWSGVGNLSGYTQAEVAAVPIMSTAETLAYFDQARSALAAYLAAMPAERLGEPVTALSAIRPAYPLIRTFLMDGHEHLGEIKAIKAMWQRRQKIE